ncbi:MAG: dihydroxyacetone kinase subunit DhaL [Spirochaetia bacterium]|jgi:dihydroxyacetone kinase-like protein
MEAVGIPEIRSILGTVARIMTEKKDELIRLDGAVGDGDLGLTMEKAFVAARDDAASSTESDVGKFLTKIGMTIARTAPSTMGTLVATGFMSGGKAVGGTASLGPKEMAAFFDAFVSGIMQRGKSKPGEKTIVDVLYPAAQALKAAADSGAGLADAFRKCRAAAQEGLEKSRGMQAQHGRVAYYQEQSKGKEDPGAVAGNYMIQGFVSAISGEE